MRTLMLSLDQHITVPQSAVAERMRQQYTGDQLDIVVPVSKTCEIALSPTVMAWGIGGSTWQQLLGIYKKITQLSKINSYSMITVQDPFILGCLGLSVKHKQTLLEVQLHGDFFSSTYYRTSGLKNWMYYWLARVVVLPRADRIRVVGERIKQSLLALGIAESKIVVRPVTLPRELMAEAKPRQDNCGFPPGWPVFLILGRLDPVKNIAWLLDIFAGFGDNDNGPALVIVGSGPEEKRLKQLVVQKSLSNRVRFIAWTEEPYGYLKSVTALLFPSLSEGYGRVVMEALAVHCPVIMSDVGVAHFEVKPSETVKIIPLENKQQWCEEIKILAQK